VHIARRQDLLTEADRITDQIRTYHADGMAYEGMAVLFRTNRQMQTLAGKLLERGIPFSMKERLPNLFETWMAKDILAYIRLGLGDRSRALFLKIANRPVRYLSRAAFSEPQVNFSSLRAYYVRQEQVWMLERLNDFENELRTIRTLSPYSAVNYIRKGIGYDDFLADYAKERGIKPDDWLDVLDELQDTTRDKVSIPEWLAFVESYGETLEELREEKEKQEQNPEGVSLMTMHGAKGLEFQTVFIPTLNEGICPYQKAIRSGELEEERRMLYVAMTRAKEHLHLSFVKERFHKEVEPSRFVSEISPEMKNKLRQ
jgi:DNA helicase-2/ATP-dependent DNA helicase PcrA